MNKGIPYLIVSVMLLGITQAVAQIAMPDTVCVGTTRTYSVNDASVPSTYTWKIEGITQTSTRNEMTVAWNTPGVFELTVQERSAAGCDGDIRSGLVYVNPPPVANAGPDVRVCFGNTVRLNGSGGGTYQWTPPTGLSDANAPNPLVSMPAAGVYKYALTVSSNGCQSLQPDTVNITLLPPANIFAGRDTLVAINQPLQLLATDVSGSGFVNYAWLPSYGLNNSTIKNPVARLDRDIIYTVTAFTAEGCTASDDIQVKVFRKADLYVPTAFSPNGDGLNDMFNVIPVGIKTFHYFKIFNRYGQVVFETTNPARGWNGLYKGSRQDGQVFVWTAEAVDYEGNTLQRKGTVTLVR